MPWLGRARGGRPDAKARAARFVAAVRGQVDPSILAWLTARTTSPLAAEGALRLAQGAVSRVVAESDALDDQTAADVTQALHEAAQQSAAGAPGGTAWAACWLGYDAARRDRAGGGSVDERLAREFLRQAGVEAPSADDHHRARQVILALRLAANAALRAEYGTASLPEDRRPSTLQAVRAD